MFSEGKMKELNSFELVTVPEGLEASVKVSPEYLVRN